VSVGESFWVLDGLIPRKDVERFAVMHNHQASLL
jgi:hypothetical protein